MPTPTDYTYSAAGDTASGTVNAAVLDAAIRSSAIITALDGVSVEGDVITITFKDALSISDPDDKTNLDAVVAAHDGAVTLDQSPSFDANGAQVITLKNSETQIGMQSVQVLNTPDISADMIKSYQITADAQVTEILDIYIGDDLVGATGRCYLAGGEYRCRTDVAEGSSLNFQIVDRNDVLGLFGLYGMSVTRLSGLTFNNGTIDDVEVGDSAVGGTSGAVSEVLGKGADYLEVQFHEATFSDGENITFTRGGSPVASLDCDLGTWDEGDVIVLQTSVKDEWVEGYDVRDVHPGGSKEVPEGMYFRVKFHNNHATDPARVKVSLTVGKL